MQDTRAEDSLMPDISTGAQVENTAQRREPALAQGSRREAHALAGQVS